MTSPATRKVRILLWVPLIAFVAFVGLVASGLLKPTANVTLVSKLVGKPLPEFALPPGVAGQPGLTAADFRAGKPRLLNIFASWCVPCAAEAPVLKQLADAGVEIDAVAIRDRPEDIARFLGRWGNPYARIGSDVDSSIQFALGSSGVPETFVIDGKGVIRHQHIGDIRAENVPEILAALKDAER